MDKPRERSALDLAADLFVYAPVGLAIEIGKHLPDLARQGREQLQGPLAAAKFVGNMAAAQGRNHFGDKLREATEPIFGKQAANSPTTATETSTSEPKSRERSDLPIAGYETLSANQVLSHLDDLSPEGLQRVREYEVAGRGRKTVLNRIDQLLGQ